MLDMARAGHASVTLRIADDQWRLHYSPDGPFIPCARHPLAGRCFRTSSNFISCSLFPSNLLFLLAYGKSHRPLYS